MFLILSIAGGLILAFAIAGAICYRAFAVPAMQPLLDRTQCEKIVADGRGVFWVCGHAMKTGRCPCQPCAVLRAAKGEGRGVS